MAKDKKDKKVAKGKTGEEVVAEPTSSTSTSWTCAECEQEHEGEDAAETACVACEAPRPETDGSSTEVNDRFKGYKVLLVFSVLSMFRVLGLGCCFQMISCNESC